MKEFDLVQPLVWNEQTGHLVAGHQRLDIARDQGTETLPCVVVNLPPTREKALNIALNNPAVGSDWDEQLLSELLETLDQSPEIDATLTGFDTPDIQDLLMKPTPMNNIPQDPPVNNQIRATLLIAPKDWNTVRNHLDTLITNHDIELHIQLPPH